ncbi:MAG: hypothetical protein R3F20_09820 [Planctomycetota bacterium]
MENRPPKQDGICDLCGGTLYQRSDDNEESARHRLEVFEASTRELVEFYDASGRLRRIDAGGTMEEVTASLEAIL